MDRIITAKFQADRATDILNIERNVMVTFGALMSALLGTGPTISGLVANSVPGSLAIQIGPGAIFMPSSVDQVAFGVLPADSSTLMKCGVNLAPYVMNMPTTPPTGQVVNVLVEASLVEYDTTVPATPNYAAASDSVVGSTLSATLPYGLRRQALVLRALPGTPATAGSQGTPSVQAGWVPLYTVTVASSDTSVQPGNIVVFPGAPFITSTLPQIAAATATGVNGATLAPLASPQLTGAPTATTPENGDNSNRIATTAFVQNNTLGSFNPAGLAPIQSPVFTGMPTAPTPPNSDVSERIATTAFVVASMTGGLGVSGFATKDSPQFTGNPTAPTANLSDSSGALATTAFVRQNLQGYALLSGATFTGTVTAPTPAFTDSSTHLATTAYVQNAISLANTVFASSATFTGPAIAVTPSSTDNSTHLATTAFVQGLLGSTTRIRLKAATTLQVSTSGNDSTGSLSTSFATVQGAWNWAQANLDLYGYTLTILVGNGIYNQPVLLCGRLVGQETQSVYVTGNTASPSSVTISPTFGYAFEVAFGAQVILQGMTLSSPAASTGTSLSGYSIAADYSAVVGFDKLIFGAASAAHIIPLRGSLIYNLGLYSTTTSNYSIIGSAPIHYYAGGHGDVFIANANVTLSAGLAFNYFAVASVCGCVTSYNCNFIGTQPTATKFLTEFFGPINVNGSGINYFPGTVAGVVTASGFYA